MKASLRNFYYMYRGLHKDTPKKIKYAVYATILQKLNRKEKSRIREIEQIRCNFNPGTIDAKEKNTLILSSARFPWSLLLFNLIKAYKPLNALELGTCIGISAAYQGVALQANGKGKLITIEGTEKRINFAKANIESLHLDNVQLVYGIFNDVLLEILEKNRPIDYAFIDGHHDEEATVHYYRMLLPYLSPGALLVFDDIVWSEGMQRAWQKILQDTEHIESAVDLTMFGLVVIR